MCAGKWAKGWSVCKRIQEHFFVLEKHLNDGCPRTNLIWLAPSGLAAAGGKVFSAHWNQARQTCRDLMCLALLEAPNPWAMRFGHICFPPEPTQNWSESFTTRSTFSLFSFCRFLCKTGAVWKIPHWPSEKMSCCGWTQSISILVGITWNVARKSKLFV